MSLKEARLTRDKAQALLNDGIDPTEHKNHEKNNFIGDYPITSITAQDVIKTGLSIQTYFE